METNFSKTPNKSFYVLTAGMKKKNRAEEAAGELLADQTLGCLFSGNSDLCRDSLLKLTHCYSAFRSELPKPIELISVYIHSIGAEPIGAYAEFGGIEHERKELVADCIKSILLTEEQLLNTDKTLLEAYSGVDQGLIAIWGDTADEIIKRVYCSLDPETHGVVTVTPFIYLSLAHRYANPAHIGGRKPIPPEYDVEQFFDGFQCVGAFPEQSNPHRQSMELLRPIKFR